MGYTLSDEGRFLDLGPSINGLRELKKFLSHHPKTKFPALQMFLEDGYTPLTKALATECRVLAKLAGAAHPDVAISLTSLGVSASKARGIIILSC